MFAEECESFRESWLNRGFELVWVKEHIKSVEYELVKYPPNVWW